MCNRQFGKPLVPYFQPLVVSDAGGPWYLGEDYSFCERARRAGFRILADTGFRLRHVGPYGYSWEDAGASKERFRHYTFHAAGVPTQQPAPDER